MELIAENRTPREMLGIALIRGRIERCMANENARLVNAILWDSNFENGAEKLRVTFEEHEDPAWLYVRVECLSAEGHPIPDPYHFQMFSISLRDIRYELSSLRTQLQDSFSLLRKINKV